MKKKVQDLRLLSTEELKQLWQQAVKSERNKLAKENYGLFLQFMLQGDYKRAKHTEILCSKLQDVADGKIKRLIITMPPRHSKSTTVSRYFPAWYLGNHPDDNIMIISYGATLAEDFSLVARETLREFGEEIFGVELSKYKKGVKKWNISHQSGSCMAAGVGGPITGRGAQIAILDDPISNWDEAQSVTMRNGAWDWYQSVLRSRLTPTGAIIIVQTRWHTDDLVGRLEKEAENGGTKWEIITMQAISDGKTDDILGREEGEALWPEEFNLQVLEETKRDLGIIKWSCLYQQNPAPLSGYTFNEDWLRYYTDDDIVYNPSENNYYFKGEPIIARYASCDPAVKIEEINDYTAIIVADITRSKNVIIRKILQKKINIPDQLKTIVYMQDIWHPSKFFLEDVGYQLAIRDVILSQDNYVPFSTIKRGGKGSKSKEVRISEMSPMFECNKVYIKTDMTNFLEEYKLFPSAKNDDILDATEMILSKVRDLPNFGKATSTTDIQRIKTKEITVPKSIIKFNHFNFQETGSKNLVDTSGNYFKFS